MMKDRVTIVLLALIAATTSVFGLPGNTQAQTITVGPGAFEYRYDSQDAAGFGAADPNAVLNNILFSGDGGAPNVPPNFVNFYVVDQFVNGSEDGESFGTVTYTFEAATGQMFSGDVSVTDRITVFNFNGNIRGEFSIDGGTTFTDYTQRGSGEPEFATNVIDVDGTASFILRYNLANIRNDQQRDQTQLFRQANVGLGNLEPTPFVVSGLTVPIGPGLDDADFDGDGDVDGADFLTFQRGLGITGTAEPADGDANGDMNVDAADLEVFRQQFGTGGNTVAAVAAVPEPSTFSIAALGISLVLWGRKRHSARPSGQS